MDLHAHIIIHMSNTSCPCQVKPPSSSPQPAAHSAIEHLVIDLFSGMDGAGVSAERVGVNTKAPNFFTIFYESSQRCRALLRHHRMADNAQHELSDFTDAKGIQGSVMGVSTPEQIHKLIQDFPNLKSVLIIGGSPCVGFSSAKTNRRGTFDEQSKLLAVFPVAVANIRQTVKASVIVFFVLENVSMNADEFVTSCGALITKVMNVKPATINCADFSGCHRERSYWTNIQQLPVQSRTVDPANFLDQGWRPAWEFPSMEHRPDLRFGTFTRGFDIGHPPEVPDDVKSFPRLPLHAYSDRLMVVKQNLSDSEKTTVAKWMSSSVRISTQGIRDPGSPAMQARSSLVKWIHQEDGHKLLRPLNGSERDRLLGFNPGASSLPDDPKNFFVLGQHQSTGNSFSINAVSHVLQPWATWINNSGTPPTTSGMPTITDFETAVAAIQPPASAGGRPH